MGFGSFHKRPSHRCSVFCWNPLALYPNQNGKVAKVTVRIRRLQVGSGVVIDEDGPVVSD